MTAADLYEPLFNVLDLRDADFVRYEIARWELDAGNRELAEQIVAGQRDEYSPVAFRLFLCARIEAGPEFCDEWDRLAAAA